MTFVSIDPDLVRRPAKKPQVQQVAAEELVRRIKAMPHVVGFEHRLVPSSDLATQGWVWRAEVGGQTYGQSYAGGTEADELALLLGAQLELGKNLNPTPLIEDQDILKVVQRIKKLPQVHGFWYCRGERGIWTWAVDVGPEKTRVEGTGAGVGMSALLDMVRAAEDQLIRYGNPQSTVIQVNATGSVTLDPGAVTGNTVNMAFQAGGPSAEDVADAITKAMLLQNAQKGTV